MKKVFTLLLLGTLLNSCNVLLGIKKPKKYSDTEVLSYHEKRTHGADLYSIDPQKFLATYDSVKIHDRLSFDQFIQPMQILVFDKNKELITHLVNCNVGGLPLKWNRTGSFDHFPLRANGLYEPQHRVKLSVMGEYLQPQLTEEDFQQILDHHDYLYVIVYTRCMASMSRGMFDHMNKHIEKFSNEKVRYLYVYAEDLYVELDKKKSK